MLEILKYVHICAIGSSVGLVMLRYSLMIRDAKFYKSKFFKILSPILDTTMLTSGIVLMFLTGYIPFTAKGAWMTEKVICVMIYVAFMVAAFQGSKGKVFRSVAFFTALGWLMLAAKITLSKTPLLG